MDISPLNLITILGPTAAGKTSFAAHLARVSNSEIISGDSRQVYKDMNLGTGKDYQDYIVDGVQVPYHLIDIAEAGYKYNVYEYQHDFLMVYEQIRKRQKNAILCGGTGMYIDAILRGYKLVSVPTNDTLRAELQAKSDEEIVEMLKSYKTLHNQTDIDTRKRMIRALEIEVYYSHHEKEDRSFPAIHPLIIGVNIDRNSRRQKITQRLKSRLAEGMLDEVQKLIDKGISPDDLIYYGLEYKYLTLHLTGKLSYNDMFEELNTAIHQFAKRQMTWFRGMERKGVEIHWIDALAHIDEKVNRALEIIGQKQKEGKKF